MWECDYDCMSEVKNGKDTLFRPRINYTNPIEKKLLEEKERMPDIRSIFSLGVSEKIGFRCVSD